MYIPVPVSENNTRRQEQFEVTTNTSVLLPGSIQPSALGPHVHHTSSVVQFYARVGILVAKRGNTFFFGLGITLPLFLLVLKQFALELAEQQCWRNRPSRNTQVRKKESVCSAGSYPLAQLYHRNAG